MSRYVRFTIILTLLVFFTTTLVLQNLLSEKLPKKQLDRHPNAFMRSADYYQYNDLGQLHSHLVSKLIIHFQYKNSFHFIAPHYLFYTSQHVPWTIRADHAKSQNGIERIYLWGHVKIHEPTQAKEIATTIFTKDMTIFPHCAFAQTAQTVTIVRPNFLVTAKGMTIDFKKGLIRLLGHSRGVYRSNN